MPPHGDGAALEELLLKDFATLPELMRIHADQRPNEPALINENGDTLTFAQLDRRADQAACALQRDGISPGDTVAVCSLNRLDYAVLFVAILRVGAAIAPLAPTTTRDGLARMLDNCGAPLLLLDHSGEGARELAAQRATGTTVAITAEAPGRPFEDWLAAPGETPRPITASPDDCFNVIYSSGTTGAPKGIVHSNGLRWPQIAHTAREECRPGTVSLVATPLYSNTTLVAFLPALGGGSTLVLMSKFDSREYLRLAEQHRVTHTMLVPVQYQRLMADPHFERFDLSSFRLKSCTSAPFSAALKADVLSRWPGALVEFYGMTEGGGSCVLLAHEYPDKLASVGQPMPGNDIRIVDENDEEQPRGEIGEIVGRSDFMMIGYHKAPEKTAQATWHNDQGERFIRTGDLGYFDDEGFLYVVGRSKDTIISGGFNIYPSDIEAVLLENPDVSECAVVGVPSAQWGETPAAWVVANDTATPHPDALRAWANERLGKTQRISDVHLVASLPRNGLGKVSKKDLRDTYLADA